MIQILKISAIIAGIEALVAKLIQWATFPFLKDKEKELIEGESSDLQERYWKGNYFTTQGLGSIGEIVIAIFGQTLASIGVVNLVELLSLETWSTLITAGTIIVSFVLIAKVLIGVRLPFSLMAHKTFVQGQVHALLLFSRSKSLRRFDLNVRLGTLCYWGSISFIKLTALLVSGFFATITIKLYCVYYFLSFFFGSPSVTKYNDKYKK